MNNVNVKAPKLLEWMKYGLAVLAGIILFEIMAAPADVLQGFLDALK